MLPHDKHAQRRKTFANFYTFPNLLKFESQMKIFINQMVEVPPYLTHIRLESHLHYSAEYRIYQEREFGGYFACSEARYGMYIVDIRDRPGH